MKTPTVFARICAAAVLIAPLSVIGTLQDETLSELKITKYVEPVFPERVQLDGAAEGHVTLVVSRDAAGVPGDVLVLDSTHPQLAIEAVRAAREWRFAPGDNPVDLEPRVVRIGFKATGVVVFPFGKSHADEPLIDSGIRSGQSSIKIPRLQALSRVPKALAQPMPAYPRELALHGTEGSATVSFYVDEEGRIRLPEVVEASAPEFGRAAMAAVMQWRYEPPRQGLRSLVAYDHWSFKFQAAN
jgi:TonB family protein